MVHLGPTEVLARDPPNHLFDGQKKKKKKIGRLLPGGAEFRDLTDAIFWK